MKEIDCVYAFLSYAHFDNTHDEGALFRICDALEGEVQALTGIPLRIIRDENDLKWGEQWEQAIVGHLDNVHFLICVITPSYFASENCMLEIAKFIDIEKFTVRRERILPIYYIQAEEFEAATSPTSSGTINPIARELAGRQYQDWRGLRGLPMGSSAVVGTLSRLAERFRDVISDFRIRLGEESENSSELELHDKSEEEKIKDIFSTLPRTQQSIVRQLYGHIHRSEILLDDLLKSFKIKYGDKKISKPSDLYYRIYHLESLGLIKTNAIEARVTNIITIPLVKHVIEKYGLLESR